MKQLELTNLIFFNGAITVQNTNTGEHRTFRLLTQPEEHSFRPGERILSILTGPNNETDYEAFAFVDETKGISVWKRFRGNDEKRSAHDYYADMICGLSGHPETTRDWATEGYSLQVEKMCCRCNRRLTTPESIEAGMGPTCREKSNA